MYSNTEIFLFYNTVTKLNLLFFTIKCYLKRITFTNLINNKNIKNKH